MHCYVCRVADINQSLVDDALVDKEKIGGTNYYWSFPAKKDRLLQIQHEKVLCNIELLEKESEIAHLELLDAQRGREDEPDEKVDDGVVDNGKTTDTESGNPKEEGNADEPSAKKLKMMNRTQKLQRLQEITALKNATLAELDALKENDPQAIADLEHELRLVHQAANRWTDNIFNCQTYLTKKRGMDKKEAMKLLGITDSFDCTFCVILVAVFFFKHFTLFVLTIDTLSST
jgi:Leucine zipper with capping helix domain/Mnd1 HTH domain